MAKFLQGNGLNSELEKIFETAESQIILAIVSECKNPIEIFNL